ncbi:MAG: AAA family ATPase, partial [Bacteroidetes bacterium]
MIKRAIEKYLVQDITEGKKVVIVYGARQVGKTTLVRKVIGDLHYSKLEVNADLLAYQDVLSSRDL